MHAYMNSEIREFVIAGVSFKYFRELTEALPTNLTRADDCFRAGG